MIPSTQTRQFPNFYRDTAAIQRSEISSCLSSLSPSQVRKLKTKAKKNTREAKWGRTFETCRVTLKEEMLRLTVYSKGKNAKGHTFLGVVPPGPGADPGWGRLSAAEVGP